jgi:hypothetical protein
MNEEITDHVSAKPTNKKFKLTKKKIHQTKIVTALQSHS